VAVAVDAMGGDRAPTVIIQGAVQALLEESNRAGGGVPAADAVHLVGDRSRIDPEIERALAPLTSGERERVSERLEIRHATQSIDMAEPPARALRRKPDSSIGGCVKLLREGRAEALVTAGSTGAAVAATKRSLSLPGVRRPGIAVTLPSKNRVTTVIDVGANVHCKPKDLLDYGTMATEFCRALFGIPRPSIGLMNVGEEDAKGNDLVRRTMELYRQSDLDFIGNIEGRDVFSGKCDIVVCEGFVGNVILKVSEGFAEMTASWLEERVDREGGEPERAAWREALRVFKQHTDYSSYGGALLLGVDATCVICHGRSGPSAIANAIRSARRFARAGIPERIASRLRSRGGSEASASFSRGPS